MIHSWCLAGGRRCLLKGPHQIAVTIYDSMSIHSNIINTQKEHNSYTLFISLHTNIYIHTFYKKFFTHLYINFIHFYTLFYTFLYILVYTFLYIHFFTHTYTYTLNFIEHTLYIKTS